jgi:SWI/SNF related-matrix-associated actin-dependent regulator of chromatin subfamily C
MTLIRRKDGHPNVKFFESVETLNQFDTIRKALQKKDLKKIFGDDQQYLTKDSISQLVLQLLHYQEDHLGKQSNGSAPLIRIPVNELFYFQSTIFFLDGMFFGLSRIRCTLYDYSWLLRI